MHETSDATATVDLMWVGASKTLLHGLHSQLDHIEQTRGQSRNGQCTMLSSVFKGVANSVVSPQLDVKRKRDKGRGRGTGDGNKGGIQKRDGGKEGWTEREEGGKEGQMES